MAVSLLLESGSKALLESGNLLLLEPTVYNDSGTATVHVVGSGTDQWGIIYNDSGSGTIHVVGSGSDTYDAYTPGPTYKLLLESGSKILLESDAALRTETPAPATVAIVTITAYGTESHYQAYTDSGTATVRVVAYGSGSEVIHIVQHGTRISQSPRTGTRTFYALVDEGGNLIVDENGDPFYVLGGLQTGTRQSVAAQIGTR